MQVWSRNFTRSIDIYLLAAVHGSGLTTFLLWYCVYWSLWSSTISWSCKSSEFHENENKFNKKWYIELCLLSRKYCDNLLIGVYGYLWNYKVFHTNWKDLQVYTIYQYLSSPTHYDQEWYYQNPTTTICVFISSYPCMWNENPSMLSKLLVEQLESFKTVQGLVYDQFAHVISSHLVSTYLLYHHHCYYYHYYINQWWCTIFLFLDGRGKTFKTL